MPDPSSWYYVESHSNPADEVSRGLTEKQLLEGSHWLNGPKFLWESGACNPERGNVFLFLEADPEVKKASVLTTKVNTVIRFLVILKVADYMVNPVGTRLRKS